MSNNPCPSCSASRPGLEDVCPSCGWRPIEPLGEHGESNRIEFEEPAVTDVPRSGDSRNPYMAPSGSIELASVDAAKLRGKDNKRRSLRRIAFRWLTVCGISATISFFLGSTVTSGGALPMVLGVLIFVVGYIWIDFATTDSAFRKNKRISVTLKITYGIRIAVSVIFPIGMYIDVVCGAVSVGASQFIFGGENVALRSFGGVLVTTLIQGCLMHVVLVVLGLVVHGIQLAILRLQGNESK